MTIFKTTFAAVVLFLGVSFSAFSQKKVTIKFQNNRLFFTKVMLITYEPNTKGNGTAGSLMAPYAISEKSFPIGTKIYFANSRQIDVVMSGKTIQDKPFLIVKEEDANKTFKIF